MAKVIPNNIADEIKCNVRTLADRESYMSMQRSDSGAFMDSLVMDKEIGGRLSEYMDKAEIRTYIKDAILNRYAKDMQIKARPNLGKTIFSVYRLAGIHVESISKLHLYKDRDDEKTYFVVAEGTYLKWETALRKALEYVACAPFAENSENKIFILLCLYARETKIPKSDKETLDKALAICGGKAYFFGEP